MVSKLSGAAGAFLLEALELKNLILRFGCTSEDLCVEVTGLAYWMENLPPPPLGIIQSLDDL